jgi:hypothetical protein
VWCWRCLRCFALLCFALLCFALLCFALLCFALLCFALLCFALLCFVFFCFAFLSLSLCCSPWIPFAHAGDRKISAFYHASKLIRTSRISSCLPFITLFTFYPPLHHLQAVLNAGVAPRLVELLGSNQTSVQVRVLRDVVVAAVCSFLLRDVVLRCHSGLAYLVARLLY